MSDGAHMAKALELAASAQGLTSPNPLVGCVVVRDGEVLATGYHKAAGMPHAEIDALQKLGFEAQGATVFVNLEPCCHHAKTPPCTDALIRAGVKRVVAGMIDPNPLVAGKGLSQLEAAGIETEVGLLEEDCRQLNEGFSHYIVTGRPFVTLKSAITLDGRVATRTGASKWITSEDARRAAHRLRSISDGVMVGVGTVLADDPRLTVRGVEAGYHPPTRIVLDTHLRTPLAANVVDAGQAPSLFYCGPDASPERVRALEARGVEVKAVAVLEGRLDLAAILADLGARSIVHLMVEGGAEVAGSLVEVGLVDRYLLFVAPKIFGGQGAKAFVAGEGAATPDSAVCLRFRDIQRVGPDLLIEALPA